MFWTGAAVRTSMWLYPGRTMGMSVGLFDSGNEIPPPPWKVTIGFRLTPSGWRWCAAMDGAAVWPRSKFNREGKYHSVKSRGGSLRLRATSAIDETSLARFV